MGDGRSLRGPYCRLCDVSSFNISDGPFYYNAETSECLLCKDIDATPLAALVGTTLAVLFFFCWCSVRQPCKYLRRVAYQTLLEIRAPLKQIVAFIQVRSSCDCPPPQLITFLYSRTDHDARRGRL